MVDRRVKQWMLERIKQQSATVADNEQGFAILDEIWLIGRKSGKSKFAATGANK